VWARVKTRNQLIDNAVKDLPQGVVVPPFGRRCDPHHEWPVGMPGPAIVEDTPVGRRGCVVHFVNDDSLEIRHKASKPGATTERLHAGDHRGGRMLIARRLHDTEGQSRIDEVQFVHGLLNELIAVRQDQGPAPTPLDEQGKHNGFARPRGQHEQGPVNPTRPGGEEGGHGFILVGSGHQTERRRRRNSLHHTCSPSAEHRASARPARVPDVTPGGGGTVMAHGEVACNGSGL